MCEGMKRTIGTMNIHDISHPQLFTKVLNTIRCAKPLFLNMNGDVEAGLLIMHSKTELFKP